jgi:hypothetical protein
MPSLPSLSTCKICGFDESVHLRPCTSLRGIITTSLSNSSHSRPANTETTITDINTNASITTMSDEAKTPTSPLVGKAKSQVYEGQCHCGKVKFSVKLSPPVEEGLVTSCNCMCCCFSFCLFFFPSWCTIDWKIDWKIDSIALLVCW